MGNICSFFYNANDELKEPIINIKYPPYEITSTLYLNHVSYILNANEISNNVL